MRWYAFLVASASCINAQYVLSLTNNICKHQKNMLKTLLVIVGPTAVGKTETALSVAEQLHCPIISADSRQVYRELKIGTATPTAEQLQRVKHYLVGHRSVADYYSAYEFEQDVLKLLNFYLYLNLNLDFHYLIGRLN